MSDKEHFTDVIGTGTQPLTDTTQTPGDKQGHMPTISSSNVTKGAGYHVAHRNPLYSGAEHTSLWELYQVANHVFVIVHA